MQCVPGRALMEQSRETGAWEVPVVSLSVRNVMAGAKVGTGKPIAAGLSAPGARTMPSSETCEQG